MNGSWEGSRSKGGVRGLPLAAAALLAAANGLAANGTWINTTGATGYWTNAANWSAAPYPGFDGAGQRAALTNAAPGAAYRAVLDTVLPWTLGPVEIRNPGAAGEAWLVVTNTAVSLTNVQVRTRGRLEIDALGTVTNAAILMDGTNGQVLVAAGGFLFSSAAPVTIGSSGGASNVLALGDSGAAAFWNANAQSVTVGSGAAANGNILRLANGALATNINAVIVGGAGAFNNWLIVTNGGQCRATAANTPSTLGNGSSGNQGLVSGTGSVFAVPSQNLYVGEAGGTSNRLVVDNGGLCAVSTLYVGQSSNCVGNTLTITNGGLVQATNVRVNYLGSNGWNNAIVIGSGGTLEVGTQLLVDQNTAPTSVPGPVANDCVTNCGGVYQFTTATPTILSAPQFTGLVYLTSGTIAFRNVSTVDVRNNWSGTLTNIQFAGVNAFRLNFATNATSSQSYVFDPGRGATNYSRLEMVNGATRYRGGNGNTLTIGSAWGSGGEMLCSNTAAAVGLVFTNNGTLTVAHSTLAFETNATFNGTLVIDLGTLASTGAVVTAGNLALTATSALTFVGNPGRAAPLIAYTGTRSGAFGTTNGVPDGYKLVYGAASNGAITLARLPNKGTCLLVF